MKKSEIYRIAMEVVADRVSLRAKDKVEIIEQLLQDKSIADWQEAHEAKTAQEVENDG